MDSLKIPSVLPERGVRASSAAPVIIATDGQEQSDAALAIGRLLAESNDAFRLVTVLKTLPIVPEVPLPVPIDVENARRAEAKREVSVQAMRVWEADADVELHEGDPAMVISRLAHQAGAALIVAGLGRHRVTDRVFGDETALRLIRASDVPVLATAPGLRRAPRRIVVAVDFSETSLRAARLAIDVAAAGATIYLAHVAPRDSSLYDWKGWGSTYKHGIGDALQKTRDQLRVPADMTVQNVLLQGDPATELLAFATSVNADLIATGSHGHGFVARMLIGSVTTRPSSIGATIAPASALIAEPAAPHRTATSNARSVPVVTVFSWPVTSFWPFGCAVTETSALPCRPVVEVPPVEAPRSRCRTSDMPFRSSRSGFDACAYAESGTCTPLTPSCCI